MRFSTVLATALSLVPSVLLSQATNPADNDTLIVETMALMTDNTPASLYNGSYSQAVFVVDALQAINSSLSALLANDQTALKTCNNSNINDQTPPQPNCDQVASC